VSYTNDFIPACYTVFSFLQEEYGLAPSRTIDEGFNFQEVSFGGNPLTVAISRDPSDPSVSIELICRSDFLERRLLLNQMGKWLGRRIPIGDVHLRNYEEHLRGFALSLRECADDLLRGNWDRVPMKLTENHYLKWCKAASDHFSNIWGRDRQAWVIRNLNGKEYPFDVKVGSFLWLKSDEVRGAIIKKMRETDSP
jgi:hypothetical protein